ncbi:MAG: hypothetical protein JNM84_03465 [Planctomycetes bacterium]|nr:hypothetical protein [Planctomycetota bacterium]
MRHLFSLLGLCLAPVIAPAQVPMISTIAGDGTYGFAGDGGPAISAQVGFPAYLAIDSAGNIYFSDWGAGMPIRRIDAASGTIRTVIGGGSLSYPNDGALATSIELNGYGVLAVDGQDRLYFTDATSQGWELIRRYDPLTQQVSTIAGGGAPDVRLLPTDFLGLPFDPTAFWTGDGGLATQAYLRAPWSLAFDTSGDLIVGDWSVVRRIDAVTGIISTIAGTHELYISYANGLVPWGMHGGDGGPANAAGFTLISGVAIDAADNIFVKERYSLRKIDATTGIISTIAGTYDVGGYSGDGGPALSALLGSSDGIAVDAFGSVHLADYDSSVLRRIDARSGIISTVAGTGTYGYEGDGAPARSASFAGPYDLAFDGAGDLYIADTDNARIRKITGLVSNAAPSANAGPDQSIHASGTVQLDGSASFDDDTPTGSLEYSWTLVSKPPGSAATLSNPNLANSTFLADLPGTYVAELIVRDAVLLASSPDSVVISSTNLAPTANAGADQAGVVIQPVQLDGTASTDPEQDALAYYWGLVAVPSGSLAILSNPFAPSPVFLPDLPGTYVAALIVDDGFGPSLVDEVSIVVITGEEFAESTAAEAITAVAELPPASVSSAGNQQALTNFLSQTVQALQANNEATARAKLEMAIERTDGWFLRGAPDQSGPGRDWVTDRDASIALYLELVTALQAIS